MNGIDRRLLGILGAIVILQTLLFYEHLAVSLTLLFSLGIGLWLRHWTAALWAVLAFLVAYLLAVITGWLHDARPIADALIGIGLAFLGGLIGGGIFQVLREERPIEETASEASAYRRTAVRPHEV
jgi:hypothetical protein